MKTTRSADLSRKEFLQWTGPSALAVLATSRPVFTPATSANQTTMNPPNIPTTQLKIVEADGIKIFYREAGPADGPVLLLLHGYPTSSHMFRHLMPRLASTFRVVAPDLPGFGFTEVPAGRNYDYRFDNLAETTDAFVQKLNLTRYALCVFDYGAPTGYRLAVSHPDKVVAIISQNGNA